MSKSASAEVSNVRTLPRRPSKPPATPKAPKPEPGPVGVVGQVKIALQPSKRIATCLGFILGGFVPIASYVVAHGEIDASRPLYAQVSTLLVLGGLLFSAKTVYAWARLAFGAPSKALGFVVLVEGCLTLSTTHALALAALAVLVGVNGAATGCALALDRANVNS